MKLALYSLIVCFVVSGGSVHGQEVIFTGAKINHTESPKSAGDFTREILNNDILKGASVRAIEAYFGVPSQISSQIWEVARSSPIVKTKGSEDRYTDFQAPSGYVLCKATVSNVSWNGPAAMGSEIRRGDMGPGHLAHGFTVYTHVKQEGLGGGRNWINADITMMWVQPLSVNEHNCMAHRQRVYDRKGN